MDYEKKYKEALGWMQSLYNGLHGKTKEEAEKYFPELQECEDERIRKELIDAINGLWVNDALPLPLSVGRKDKWIAWLEKQGEQKVPINDFKAKDWYVSKVDGKIRNIYYSVDKIEPKFKVGDWIITKDKNVHKDYFICKIVEIENNRYHLENGDYLDIDTLEQYDYHLWTIQDAKDGDVLACGDKVYDCPFIFHNLTEDLNPRSYCGVNTLHHFQDNDENGGFWCKSDEVRPATKEQRDLLFQKMKEAGYQWDAEKKELKLLISNGGDFESNNSKQKPTWSEDDERIVTALMEGFRYHQLFNPRFGEVPNAEIISWIKSLKERLS